MAPATLGGTGGPPPSAGFISPCAGFVLFKGLWTVEKMLWLMPVEWMVRFNKSPPAAVQAFKAL
jgi:hypothetical protein